MRCVAFALIRGGIRRLRSQAGMSMVEVMVAAVILSAGVLGVFVMVETADKVNERNRERITATSLARELLEKARPTAFSTIGTANWFDPSLEEVEGRASAVVAPTSSSARTTVTRRGVTYTVTVDACSVDEGRDGYGAHGTSAQWCTDSTFTAAADTQPEDLKRVAVSMSWMGRGGKPGTLYQTATFSSTGQVIGPTLTDLTITQPGGLSQTNPVITTDPTGGIVRFLGTAPGAADMKFAVDGVEKSSGVSGGNGSWTFDWNITSLPDGLYTISATAIDALGVRGTPRVMQVRLARAAATAPANVTGGYNYVNVAGTRTLVVELMWDASPEGNVTGYEVTKAGGTVCAASLETSCMDLAPAATGTSTYTVKTLYTDGAGGQQSVSSTYDVSAPGAGGGALPTQYVMTFDGVTMPGSQSTPKCRNAPMTTTSTFQNHFDLVEAGTWNGTSVWSTGFANFAGCLPVMTSGGSLNAGTMIWKSKWRNGGNNACSGIPIYLYLNGTTIIGGTGVNGGGTLPSIPRRSASTYYTLNFTVSARTFAAGDQLSVYTTGGSTNSNCSSTQMDFGHGYNGTTAAQLDLPLGGGGGGSTLTRPAAPTGLTTTDNGDGTVTLTWTPPTGTPAPEFYRIYRDGQDYTHRVDTAGHNTVNPTMSWTDTDRGGTTHTYRVTTVSSVLAESDFAGPVTR